MTDPARAAVAASPRRRRRAWPWLISLLIVAILLAWAAVAAEWLARGAVEGGIRTLVVTELGVPESQIDVDVDGIVIPQLISGTLDDVTLSSPEFTRGALSGDVTVSITDMPIRADAPAGSGTATVRLDEGQLRALLATVEDFPADAAGIAAPEVTLETELSVLGAAIPVGVGLLPAAAGGDLTLTPQSFTVGGSRLDADGLRAQFGGLTDTVLRSWNVCVAQYLPAALSLNSVAVDGAEVVAVFDIDGAVVVDSVLRQNGTCG